ncbi:MAG TPA: FAD-binding oxidoreductase [Vicinamibacterales bacterium]|nr:FAD-binding oxidoreductase [Vicinamibacterales bacterium]
MKTRYGVSPWVAGVPDARRPSFDRFRGELSTEVAIIGGGLTGCALAFSLAAAGFRPVVLEADRIGQSGAGRASGLMLPDPGPPFRDVQQKYGLRAARAIFEMWRRASLDGAALLRRASVKCQLAQAESLLVTPLKDEKTLQREHEARQAAGVESSWLSLKQARAASWLEWGPALRIRAGFTLDPYRACIGLAGAAVKRRASIFERSPVRKVRAAAKDVEITLDGGTIRASTVVVATGAATAEFKPLRRHFKPRLSHLVLTEPVGAALRKRLVPEAAILRDTLTPPHRLRWAGDHRLLISGADQNEIPAKRRDATRVQRTGQLMYELLMMYPDIAGLQPEFGWEVPYGATADGLPYIGPHRNYPRHLFALGGDDSSTGAFLSARLLTRRLQDQPQKGDEVFGWTR